MENKYYYCGDSTILVLKILVTEDKSNLYLCLHYSDNHNVYNLVTIESESFERFYKDNELIDYEYDDLFYRGLI